MVPAAEDEHFMRMALEQAQQAASAGEVPVGAVLVSGSGAVLAAARNRAEGDADPTAHAEMLCIRQAAARRGGWRLTDATLYVTLEPCPMCAGAALQARVGTVVYGARNSLLGADGSWIAMLPEQQAAGGPASGEAFLTGGGEAGSEHGEGAAQRPQRPHPFHPGLCVRRGVLEAECGLVMKEFFKQRRRQAGAGVAADVELPRLGLPSGLL